VGFKGSGLGVVGHGVNNCIASSRIFSSDVFVYDSGHVIRLKTVKAFKFNCRSSDQPPHLEVVGESEKGHVRICFLYVNHIVNYNTCM
jgi:hypothetical protein